MTIKARHFPKRKDPVDLEFDRCVELGSRANYPADCPFPQTDLFRRCAWLAGYYDARREGFA